VNEVEIVQAFDRTGVRLAGSSAGDAPLEHRPSPADQEDDMTTTLAPRRPVVHTITDARPPVAAPVAAPARLTRRGRLVVLLALVTLLFAVALAATGGFARAGDDRSAAAGPVATTWVVQPGETLWQVAEAVAPGEDPRETVARIVELNGLADASVTVGQSLLVPA
jgi:nucleoid-associated protein YgaU